MSDKLQFGSGGDPFAAFDAAPEPAAFDLSAFDAATGTTTVPAGVYVLRVERGELTKTKADKPAYRLCFKTVEPADRAGFTLWRWFVLDDLPGFNRAKAALAPLGLRAGEDLRRQYPPIGAEVFVRAVVTLKTNPQYGPSNGVERFEPCDPPAGAVPPPNPFAVPLPPPAEGGQPQ